MKSENKFIFGIVVMIVIAIFAFEALATGTLRDYHNSNDNGYNCTDASASRWRFQSFVANETYILDEVHAKVYGTSLTGTVEMHLYAVDGSHEPTGSILDTGSINANTVVASPGSWLTWTMTSTYEIQQGTEYAFVMDFNGNGDGCGSTFLAWRKTSADDFAEGYAGDCDGTETTCTAESNPDHMFETYGTDVEAGGGETATTTFSYASTTIVSMPSQDYFNGLVLFLMTFFGFLFYFKRK